jgi:hypothetical protein
VTVTMMRPGAAADRQAAEAFLAGARSRALLRHPLTDGPGHGRRNGAGAAAHDLIRLALCSGRSADVTCVVADIVDPAERRASAGDAAVVGGAIAGVRRR